MENRIIFEDDTTLSDKTKKLANYHSGSFTSTFVAAEDKIFIGSYFPFNHLYIKMGSTVNANASVMTVKYWDGSQFRSVVELTDETDSGGATLAQDGFISFVPDKKYSWVAEDTVNSGGTEKITGLGDVTIYERYWLEITVSADLTASMVIDWIGNLFSNDDDLDTEYPDLLETSFMSAFKASKTNWEEQAVRAAEYIIKDLKRMNIILDRGQIIQKEEYMMASVHKVAEIAYTPFGESRVDDKDTARKAYRDCLTAPATIDKNKNAINDEEERNDKTNSHGFR